jgi:catechol 2,3-dioxygenase-like lactoylglutathione lyase family enzyme
MADDVIAALATRTGRWRGDGRRYGGAAFDAEIELKPVLGGRGVSMVYVAREDGAVIHHEEALVAHDPEGRPAMWTFHTNTDGVWQQRYRGERATGDGGRAFLFGIGDVENGATLRTEISLELYGDGTLGHRRIVGVPGGEFLERSRARARRAPSFDIWHVAIPVSDLERSVEFWCGRLGWSLLGRGEYEDKRQAYVGVRPGGFVVELFEPLGEAAERQPRRPDHLAFECDDIESFRESIGEAEPVRTFDNGVRYLRIADPDGVELEFYQGRAIFEDAALRPALS